MANNNNGALLRAMISASGLTQMQALDKVNKGQAFPVALSTWKSYLADPHSVRFRNCPEKVMRRARQVLTATS